MSKTEFLEQLQEELGGQLTSAELREQIDYYSQYIDDEIAKGNGEDSVLADLGDPWAIAHNILDDKERKEGKEAARKEQAERDAESDRDYAREQRVGGAWSYILVLVAVLLIIGLIVSLVFGVMGFLFRELPVLFIIIVVWWVYRRLRN